MIIKTRFDIGDKVWLIEDNKIITLPVKDVECKNRNIKYSLCKRNAPLPRVSSRVA